MTDLRKIAAAMGGEVHGNVAAFPTPGHSKADRGSWASIVPGAPDGVLINSRNGGDPLAIKDELRAKGVLPSRDRTLRARDVGAWDYIDADGAVAYRKVRMALPNGGKSYRFEHPDGRGGWRPKRGDAPDAFERAVLERRMRHNGSPILKWQAGNVIIEADAAGNRKPSKAKSIDRIDGIVAAIMACGVAATDEGPQVYRGAGLEWV